MSIAPALALKQKKLLALTPDMQRALAILQMGAHDLTDFLKRQADMNPLLSVGASQDGHRDAGAGRREGDDFIATMEDRGPCLVEHVLGQLALCGISPEERGLALLLTDALTPAGWLEAPLAGIAERHGVALPRLERVLGKLQGMEPTGLFARDLTDCLRLQLDDAGWLDGDARKVLAHLKTLEAGGVAALSRVAALPRARVEAVLRRVRTLDPKPGLAFSRPPVQTIRPDLIADRDAHGAWRVTLDRSMLPDVRVDDALYRDMSRHGASEDLKTAYGTARWLVSAVARRQETVLRIGVALVQHQRGFLNAGPSALRPLLQRDLAGELGYSESTVSRVVNATFMQTPSGTLPLKRFFMQPIGTAGGTGDQTAGVSPAWLCETIRAQISVEDPKAPLSDAEIAAHFAQRGLTIARRTVAKYRAQMGIPVTYKRRRKADRAG
ncbi:RNA polymerase factor sigma-54 [Stappia sp.]|uniref:RNA polymerase factor sigma-54 n=1 Tax=Stappia sp. TaxID=1870903 RepID=UPI0032D8BCF1